VAGRAVSGLSRGCLGARITLATVSRFMCDLQRMIGIRIQCVKALANPCLR
jgi:hypothetical protein